MKLFALAFALALASPAAAQSPARPSPPTDRDIEGLVGAVKSFDEEEAEVKESGGQAAEGRRRHARTLSFDRRGRMIRRIIALPDHSTRTYAFSYDKEKRYTSYTLPASPDAPFGPRQFERLTVTLLRYDEAERALYQEVYTSETPSPRSLSQRWRYTFDAEGRLAESLLYTTDGREGIRTRYDFDAGRHPTEARHYAAGRPVPEVTRYTYTLDARGNWTKRVADTMLADKLGTRRVSVTYRKLSYF
ncbi:MAG TPA: hypothetical protein VEQ42_07705 [Pyrinomonadaceae bacterium]|nr:hypothetical protein [Pyrinomonadaceae bacterium]